MTPRYIVNDFKCFTVLFHLSVTVPVFVAVSTVTSRSGQGNEIRFFIFTCIFMINTMDTFKIWSNIYHGAFCENG